MDFALNDDQQAIRDLFHGFADRELRPAAGEGFACPAHTVHMAKNWQNCGDGRWPHNTSRTLRRRPIAGAPAEPAGRLGKLCHRGPPSALARPNANSRPREAERKADIEANESRARSLPAPRTGV